MSQEQNSPVKRDISFSTIQKYLFWAMLFLLPLAIMPFPWDWTERSMGIVILLFSTLIVAIEIIKVVWEGKTTILKSTLDIGFFLLLLSMFISTLLSVDFNTSIWGIDARLGSGLILFISSLLVAISARTFIKTEKDFKFTVFAFLSGFLLSNVFSLLSFFGVNIWGMIPSYRDLHMEGLPLLRSSKVHVLLNIVSLVLCMNFIGEYLIDKKGETRLVLPLTMGVVSILNIILFSLTQGMYFIIVSLVVLILFSIFLIRKIKLESSVSRQILIFSLVTISLILIPFALLQIPSIRTAIIPEDFNLVMEVGLGPDISWMIAMSAFATSFVRAVFGMGVDTYAVSYNLFRPMDVSLLAFNDVTFYHAGSELFTQFTNQGLIWLFVWIFTGYLLFKSIWSDIKSATLNSDAINGWRLLLVDMAIAIIYISSIFVTYSVLVLLLLFVLVSLRSVVKTLLEKDSIDRFVVKFWAVDLASHLQNKKYTSNLSVVLTVLIAIIFGGLSVFWASKAMASFNTLRAEAYLIRESAKYQEVEPTVEERDALIESLMLLRSRAVNLDSQNPLYARRLALIYAERLVFEVEIYNQMLEEDEGQDTEWMISNVLLWKGSALEMSRKSIDLAPSIYSNWDVNSRIHLLLVDLGLSDHESEVTNSLNRALELNPINYQLHFSRAQLFLMQEDMESSLQSFGNVLTINPYHIPSVLIVANIYKEMGNMEMYEAYLKAAKEILEQEGLTELEIYNELVQELAALAGGVEFLDAPAESVLEFPQDLDDDVELDLGIDQQSEEPLFLRE